VSATIRIIVRLVGVSGGGTHARELPAGSTVGDALRSLGGYRDVDVSVLIGGRVVEWSQVLRDGDELLVIPPLAGG
jgi:molybdopterin converting factor small subunit